MSRKSELNICCGFSRDSDYITETSQTVKIKHTKNKLSAERYLWSWTFAAQRNLRSEQTGLSQCETEPTIGVEPIWSEQYKQTRVKLNTDKVMLHSSGMSGLRIDYKILNGKNQPIYPNLYHTSQNYFLSLSIKGCINNFCWVCGFVIHWQPNNAINVAEKSKLIK